MIVVRYALQQQNENETKKKINKRQHNVVSKILDRKQKKLKNRMSYAFILFFCNIVLIAFWKEKKQPQKVSSELRKQ